MGAGCQEKFKHTIPPARSIDVFKLKNGDKIETHIERINVSFLVSLSLSLELELEFQPEPEPHHHLTIDFNALTQSFLPLPADHLQILST
jgi:hypothetical protein